MRDRHTERDRTRRSVELCKGTPTGTQKGGQQTRLWAFGVGALAKILGISEGRVRNLLSRHRDSNPESDLLDPELDPTDLESICREWAVRKGWSPPST